MNKPVRAIMLDEAKEAYEKLNAIIGEQLAQGTTSSDEIQLLNSIKQKL
ncbi:hypothetical protein HY641_03650 [Candidatus Woesearchaeota archaeon]|nr:hypothetical protein [Candidatus Woesearchaeota archaeon]